MPTLIFYTKPGSHLCEGLEEKLEQLKHLPLELKIRDITLDPEWFQKYQYEVPVLCRLVKKDETTDEPAIEQALPRLSPRAPVKQLEKMLQTYLGPFKAK